MREYGLREIRYNKNFVTGLPPEQASYHRINLDNFALHYNFNYQFFYQQLQLITIDLDTFAQVLNRSLITEPRILKFLDQHFVPDGCFCCYYTEDINRAEQFNQLAAIVYQEHDLQQYLTSARLKQDLVDLRWCPTETEEQEIKQQLMKYISINPQIREIIIQLNQIPGLITAYSATGLNSCSGVAHCYLVVYQTEVAEKLINYLRQNLPITTERIGLRFKDRYPYPKVKIRLRSNHQSQQFWSCLRNLI